VTLLLLLLLLPTTTTYYTTTTTTTTTTNFVYMRLPLSLSTRISFVIGSLISHICFVSYQAAVDSGAALPDEYDPWRSVMGAFLRDGEEVMRIDGVVKTVAEDGSIVHRPFAVDSRTLTTVWNSRALGNVVGNVGDNAPAASPTVAAGKDPDPEKSAIDRVDIRSFSVHTSHPGKGYNGGEGSDGACQVGSYLIVFVRST
jgi:hypothetical protein